MSDSTPRLRIPELVSMQEANAVTWNEALVQLDAFVDLYLLGQYVNTPPGSPADGDAYLLGGSPTGAWNGYAYKIASCIDGAWRYYTPFNGLRAYVATSGAFIVYVNGTWTDWNSLISANEVSIASAATCDLGAAGSLFVQITGTTTITSFGTGANKLRFVRFAQALTLTHNATSLILLGGASRTTAAGDVGIYASDASGNWRERSYFRAAVDAGALAPKANPSFTGTMTLPDGGTVSTGGLSTPATISLSYGTSGVQKMRLAMAGADGNAQWRTNCAMTAGVKDDSTKPSWAFILSSVSDNFGVYRMPANTSGENAWVLFFNVANNGAVTPGTDNSQTLGSSSLRWSTVYAATGTINTSGAATKTNVRAMSDAEIAVAKALAANVRIFQFCDAVAKKGEGAARLHVGMIYEDVVAAFAAQGLDPERYSIVCRDAATKTVTKTRTVQRGGEDVEESYQDSEPDLDETGAQKWTLGLRYGELAEFVMAGLAARIAALEAK